MELARNQGIDVIEADISPYDARAADEIWFTSTTICMIPVTRFNFRPVGDGQPGPVYTQLLHAWSEAVGVDIAAQAAEYARLAPNWKP
jgi:branched-subunit amino acid aminotransferase/4-amino-4-deoxychorismate lyase